MERLLLFLFAVHFSIFAATAQQREKYEYVRNLPAYADSLIADLTYPLAWGNSDIKDFDVWKQHVYYRSNI